MSEALSKMTLRAWLKEAGDINVIPELELRDYLVCLDLNLDIESQLIAVRGLLARNLEAEEILSNEIRHIEEHAKKVSGILNEQAVDDWLDRLNHSVYVDAAHSMAAVGMLAPLVESLFFQCFQGIGRRFFPALFPNDEHERWSRTYAAQWDCHFVIKRGRVKRGLVEGIMQLAEATGLDKRLPSDLKATLSALFAYRNKMFHLGFEWPLEERASFEKTIADNLWPKEWFLKATSGESPWIFYFSKVFTNHCLATIDKVLDGISEFVRDDLLPNEK